MGYWVGEGSHLSLTVLTVWVYSFESSTYSALEEENAGTIRICMCVCSSLRKQDQVFPPFSSLLQTIWYAVLLPADNFFVRLHWSSEAHRRRIDQDLNWESSSGSQSWSYFGITWELWKLLMPGPGLCGSVGWVSSCALKDYWFDSGQGDIPWLRARFP